MSDNSREAREGEGNSRGGANANMHGMRTRGKCLPCTTSSVPTPIDDSDLGFCQSNIDAEDNETIVPSVVEEVKEQDSIPALEDIELHEEECKYYNWKVEKIKSLITKPELRTYMTKSYTVSIRAIVGKKRRHLVPIMTKDKVDDKISRGPVADYLREQKLFFYSFKDIMLKMCKCPRAKPVKVEAEDVTGSIKME